MENSSPAPKIELEKRETMYIETSTVLKAGDGVGRVKKGWRRSRMVFPIACCKHCSTASHHAASSMDIPSGAKAI